MEPVAPSRTTRRRSGAETVKSGSQPPSNAHRTRLILSSGLREREELQIAIYDRSDQNEAIQPVQEASVTRDQTRRVLDSRLAFEGGLDQVATLGGHRHESPEAGRGGGAR